MSSQMDNHSQVFREEAAELLVELEDALMEMEEDPSNMDLVNRVFRAMHTIKGSGAMFGFDDISSFTHEVETVYDRVREEKIPVTKHLVNYTLQACDRIKVMLADKGDDPVEVKMRESLVEGFRQILEDNTPKTAFDVAAEKEKARDEDGESEGEASREVTYRIRFKPTMDLFRSGIDPTMMLDDLAKLGESRIVAQTADIPMIEDFDPESCYIYWDIILTTDKGINAIRDVFIFVEDSCELIVDIIDDGGDLDMEQGADDYKMLGQILIERGDIRAEDLNDILAEKKRLGEMLVDRGLVTEDKIESALAEQEHVKKVKAKREDQSGVAAASIRVPSDKLDHLVDLVGELVTVQARLSQMSQSRTDQELIRIAEEVERLTAELRDNTMSIRMVQIGTTFSKYRRLVRDLSSDLGKDIQLVTEGGETELDKTVIERLQDPLVHLIRNSLDHGIEDPATRRSAGKDGEGTIKLSAIHAGANVLIKIADDGRGLDVEAIRQKAVDKGLISPEAELSDQEIFLLIFQPGFSTAKVVSNVSGRGVGMDVVRRSIDALRGSIEVDSKQGLGTTITLKLPLTLAIIDGLLVQIGEEFYILPLTIVEECIELTRADATKNQGRHVVKVRDELIPYVPLRELFAERSDLPDIQQIVVAEVEGSSLGFVVDRVIGGHQTVIKSLGKAFKSVDAFSGATILGDGTVALILDTHKLMQHAQRMELIEQVG